MNDITEEIIGGENSDAQSVLKRALEKFHPHIALACSFSMEDIAVAHLMTKVRQDIRVFAIDTGRLNEETYECAEDVRRVLGIRIEWYFPKHEDVERLEREKGLFSFRSGLEARYECCGIRKVEPLARALLVLKAWVTGMRAAQSVTRAGLKKAAIDEVNGGIVKINPLADWSAEDVRNYIIKHKLPSNRLHDFCYPSIGCAPCTRAVKPGEDPRAGRWWWESPEHKECGLHLRKRNNDASGKT